LIGRLFISGGLCYIDSPFLPQIHLDLFAILRETVSKLNIKEEKASEMKMIGNVLQYNL
jgi:hypothetical protein